MNTLKIQFTNKVITTWGGMLLLKNMLKQISFEEVINSIEDLPQ